MQVLFCGYAATQPLAKPKQIAYLGGAPVRPPSRLPAKRWYTEMLDGELVSARIKSQPISALPTDKLAPGFEAHGLTRRQYVAQLAHDWREALLEAFGGERPSSGPGREAWYRARSAAAADFRELWGSLKDNLDAAYWLAWWEFHAHYVAGAARDYRVSGNTDVRFDRMMMRQDKRNKSFRRRAPDGTLLRINPVGRPVKRTDA